MIDYCRKEKGVHHEKNLCSAAEDEDHVPERAISGVEGWVECFERAHLAGTVFMGGVTAAGEKPDHPALEEARELGRSC